MSILSLLLFIIFFLLSLLHLSWSMGSAWGFDASLPVNEDGQRMLNPKKIDSLIVGLGLLFFGFFYLIKSGFIAFDLPSLVVSIASWVIPSIFLMRAIGDFRYVGFTKRIKNTPFALRDTKFYSPLCLAVAIIGFILGMA